jgi:hypothetical protein
MLLFSYIVPIVPIVPIVIAWDGFVSALRVRTFEEVMALAGERVSKEARNRGCEDERGGDVLYGVVNKGWRFSYGHTMHTWPCGYMSWVVGVKAMEEGKQE